MMQVLFHLLVKLVVSLDVSQLLAIRTMSKQ